MKFRLLLPWLGGVQNWNKKPDIAPKKALKPRKLESHKSFSLRKSLQALCTSSVNLELINKSHFKGALKEHFVLFFLKTETAGNFLNGIYTSKKKIHNHPVRADLGFLKFLW